MTEVDTGVMVNTPLHGYDQAFRNRVFALAHSPVKPQYHEKPLNPLQDEILDVFAQANEFTPDEKIQLACDVIPFLQYEPVDGVDNSKVWGFRAAYDKFLKSIPTDVLTVEHVTKLLDTYAQLLSEQDVYSLQLTAFRKIETMKLEDVLDFLPKLSHKHHIHDIVNRDKRDRREKKHTGKETPLWVSSHWTKTIGRFPPEQGRVLLQPSIDCVKDTTRPQEERDLAYADIALVAAYWPLEMQKQIVEEVVIPSAQSMTDPIAFYSDLIRKWSVKDAEPVIRHMLSTLSDIPNIEWDIYKMTLHLFEATANWEPEEVQKLFTLEEFSIIAHFERDSRTLMATECGLQSLRFRSLPFLPTHLQWLQEGIAGSAQLEVYDCTSMFDSHAELFPQLATAMARSSRSDMREAFVWKIQNFDIQEQLQYHEVLVDYYIHFADSNKRQSVINMIRHWPIQEKYTFTTKVLDRCLEIKQNEFRVNSLVESTFSLLAEADVYDAQDVSLLVRFGYEVSSHRSINHKAREKLKTVLQTPQLDAAIHKQAETSFYALVGCLDSAENAASIAKLVEDFGISFLDVSRIPDESPLKEWIILFSDLERQQLVDMLNQEDLRTLETYSGPDGRNIALTKEDLPHVLRTHQSLFEAELVKRAGVDLAKVETDADYEKIFTIISQNLDWDPSNQGTESDLVKNMKAGAHVFGWKLMFAYLDRRKVDPSTHKQLYRLGLTRHDGLHHFQHILNLYNASGLKPRQFYGNILQQVTRDNKEYPIGTAHHAFNELARTIHLDFDDTLAKAQQFSSIEGFAEYLDVLKNKQAIFGKWTDLQRFSDVSQLIHANADLLTIIAQQTDPKMREYIRVIGFHPDSKVNLKALIQFITKPEEYLARSASHTPQELHDNKKPSNYTHVPNIELTAESLRDALIHGDLDTVQVFTPMEIRYLLSQEGDKPALEVTMTLHPKSDPYAVLAGNDLADCMPMEDGKAIVYTFNLNTAQLTIRVRQENGKMRTVAQSVVTKDVNIGMEIPDVLKSLQSDTQLAAVIPEDILTGATVHAACDNVEVLTAYTEKFKHLLPALYADFWAEYLERFGASQGFTSTLVPIGIGYTKGFEGLPTGPNTYAPQAPVSYSDKTARAVLLLETNSDTRNLPFVERTVTVLRDTPFARGVAPSVPGITFLTCEDTFAVSYLEGKAYADNRSLLQGMHNMENGLMAKDINNAVHTYPEMSFLYTDSSGKQQGYLLAYQGVIDWVYPKAYAALQRTHAVHLLGKPCIFISDIATNISETGTNEAGLSLLKAFIMQYQTQYANKGNALPILAQMREETSYRLIKSGILKRLLRGSGLKLDVEELPTYKAGESTMHPVVLRLKERDVVRVGSSM